MQDKKKQLKCCGIENMLHTQLKLKCLRKSPRVDFLIYHVIMCMRKVGGFIIISLKVSNLAILLHNYGYYSVFKYKTTF